MLRTLSSFLLIFVIVAFSIATWDAYREGKKAGEESAVPLIKAAQTPVKVKPKDAGGMKIPFQDLLVYTETAPKEPAQPPETTLSSPSKAIIITPKVPPPAPVKARPKQKKSTKPATTSSSTPKPAYRVQLGSMKSKESASEGWIRLKKTFPKQLQNLGLLIERADLGKKGVYHRIKAGPLHKKKAGSICKTINATKPNSCLVVKN